MKATFAELNRGKPVIRRVTLSANIDAQLVAYAKYLGAENGQVIAPEELIELMLARFMAVIECSSRRSGTGDLRGIWPGCVASQWPVANRE